MKIALYSDLGRRELAEIRNQFEASDIGSSIAEIRSFRREIMSSTSMNKRLWSSFDFYASSEIRDLLFHKQESRFTLPEISKCLHKLGLRFSGFENDTIVNDFKKTNSGVNDAYDLHKWKIFEESNPTAFSRMYEFWCQKLT